MQAPVQTGHAVRFDAFEADLRERELRKNGIRIKLQDQPFQILVVLLEHPGRLVTREELRKKLWPTAEFGEFDLGLNTAVKKLRDALGDSADTPRFIETLPRRGYRFVYPIDGHDGTPSVRRSLGRRYLALAVSALLIAGIVFAVHWARDRSAAQIRSIAVLPLENLTGDPQNEYLVEGLHDELITDLAQIGSLKVISRTSVMRYRQAQKPLREIARELGVDGIVEGTVRREGDRLHVTAQLISARDDRHLWAKSYGRDLRDMPTLPAEVTRAVAYRLGLELTPQERLQLASARPVDPAVYVAYLKGQYFAGKWTHDDLRKAINYFREALDRDPGYAPAWAGMGTAYEFLGTFAKGDDLAPEDALARAKAALQRAVELDPMLRGPHQALGRMALDDWDWERATREFQRAQEVDPSWPGGSVYLLTTGRPEEAIIAQRKLSESNPLSYPSQLTLGFTYFLAGHFDESIAALKKAADLDPAPPHAYYELAWNYAKKGMPAEAMAACEKALAILRQKQPKAFAAQDCGWVYASVGHTEEALAIARKMEEGPPDKDQLIQLAHIYDALGQRERALRWLQEAFDRRAPNLPQQWRSPMISDALAADPRFQALMQRTGIPWFNPAARQQSFAAVGTKTTPGR